MCAISILSGVFAFLSGITAVGQTPYRVVPEESVFGLVAYKAGFASNLVDNNFTYATVYTVDFIRGQTPEDVQFHIRMDTNRMSVNEYAMQTRWFPRFKELGILDTPFKETPERRRRRMAKSLVSERLLDAKNYPYVEAKTVSMKKDTTDTSGRNYWMTLDITIRGHTERVEWPATIDQDEQKMTVETHGPLTFTSFGIDPYSMFLGAIRYRDDFQIYAYMVAAPAHTPTP